jgi:beta-glucosidase
VVVNTPGAFLMPWAAQVPAILTAFMPGQEAGNAIADVLFGAVNPSARLPFSLPNKENEVGFTPAMYPGLPPCPNYTCTNGQRAMYSEGLQVGYRWYHAQNITAAFAFGHGLSYTEFDYSFAGKPPSKDKLVVVIANAGAVAGAEVAQLYISFPEQAGEPPRQLKVRGARKVQVSPDGCIRVQLLTMSTHFLQLSGRFSIQGI